MAALPLMVTFRIRNDYFKFCRNVIKGAFAEMQTHPELDNLVLNTKDQLNLCLYFIEKRYHFSGDGVWEDKILAKPETNDELEEDLPVEPPKTTEEIKKENMC